MKAGLLRTRVRVSPIRVVIQCAASKRPGAGSLVDAMGNPLSVVMWPQQTFDVFPDAPGMRQQVMARQQDDALLRAGDLYAPPIYRELVDRWGWGCVYVLSAGWGLVRADFRLPLYDITFSQHAEARCRRTADMALADFNQLDPDDRRPVVFLGTGHYCELFLTMTDVLSVPRIMVERTPTIYRGRHPNLVPLLWSTTTRTNWHYEAAAALCRGTLPLPI